MSLSAAVVGDLLRRDQSSKLGQVRHTASDLLHEAVGRAGLSSLPRRCGRLHAASFQNGFYRTSDKTWVTLERIQFVGACNPPTDPGRNPLSTRFLRHVPVIYVDYPDQVSLRQIYGTFNRAMLRNFPAVRGLAEPLTDAMVEFYL